MLPLLAGGCDHITKSWFEAYVVNRPDGAILVWRDDSTRHHLRLSTNPGGTHIQEISVFHAWASRAGRDGDLVTAPVALDYRWTYPQDQMLQFPSYTLFRGRLIAHPCYLSSDIVAIRANDVTCDPRQDPVYVQLGSRAEPLYRHGDALVFDAGLGGSGRPCAVSLTQLGGIVPGAFRRSRHYVDGPEAEVEARFAISWLPPRPAYLVDYGGEGFPIHEVSCAGLRRIGAVLQNPALADLLRMDSFREFVEILDIVPTADPDDPAMLLTWREGSVPFDQVYAVLRPKGGLRRLPPMVSERLGTDGGLCRCTAFWAGDPNRIIVDVEAHDEGDEANVRFEIFDIGAGRVVNLATHYRLAG